MPLTILPSISANSALDPPCISACDKDRPISGRRIAGFKALRMTFFVLGRDRGQQSKRYQDDKDYSVGRARSRCAGARCTGRRRADAGGAERPAWLDDRSGRQQRTRALGRRVFALHGLSPGCVPTTSRFRSDYEVRYGVPGCSAAEGYEGVHALAQAFDLGERVIVPRGGQQICSSEEEKEQHAKRSASARVA